MYVVVSKELAQWNMISHFFYVVTVQFKAIPVTGRGGP
jgi:hypothetical protein